MLEHILLRVGDCEVMGYSSICVCDKIDPFVSCILGVNIAHETPDPTVVSDQLMDLYDEMTIHSAQLMNTWSDPQAKLKEDYPIPVIEVDGKK